MQRETNEISWGLVSILCILGLSYVFKILVVFLRPKLCFSDLTFVSKSVVLFSHLSFLFQALVMFFRRLNLSLSDLRYVLTPCLCCSEESCVIKA